MLRIYILFLLILELPLGAQDLNFLNDNFYTWPDNTTIFDAIPDSFKTDDAVILKDNIDINFPDNYIKRRQAIKILNQQGLDYFTSVTLPQNFDITRINNPIYKQGRFLKRSIPFIDFFRIHYFAARIIRNKTIIELPVKLSTNKVYWVKKGGERTYDYEYTFSFEDLQINDIIEFTYKIETRGSYDSDQFYVNDYFPKLISNLSIRVIVPTGINGNELILNNNIDSMVYKSHNVQGNKNLYQNHFYKFKKLSAIKYSQNSMAGKYLPHVTADGYSYKKYLYNSTIQNSKFIYSTKYSWFIVPDSVSTKVKVYDKQGSNFRKFISSYENSADSTNYMFFSRVTNALNGFEYLPAEQLHYSKEDQYGLTSAERLIKHQLAEEFIKDIYSNILFEKNMLYYYANVQDKRFGEHSTAYRSHEAYETEFIALPVNKYYKFYIPRYNGLKYLPDELPFYYEGVNCVLIPKNTQAVKYTKGINDLKFTKTPLSTYNENVRFENAVFKFNLDSLIINATIKENLNGQFSTILRHYYNKDFIDSTISLHYFKNCLDKPRSSQRSIKLVSQSNLFPFRASYSCTEKINITKDSIDISNWFSFIFNKDGFKNAIDQNYFLDFTFTDNYNFLLEFNKPVNILNETLFNKTLSNDYFEVNSKLLKQENNNYLLSVTTKAKKYEIPKQESNLLKEYIALLSELNSLKLKLSY